jgi:hypothetical protein
VGAARLGVGVAMLLASGGLAQALAQGSIYTCVDAQGRRLTSDRPITECLDREQKEITPRGAVLRTLKPPPTAQELALEEERRRKAQEEQHRAAEERRRDKLLLARYPNRDAHDRERARALSVVQDVIATAANRTAELEARGRKLAEEAEFYKADPAKMPAKLSRQIEENQQDMAAHKRFIAAQEGEKQRLNARFDDELSRLRQLWQPPSAATTTP